MSAWLNEIGRAWRTSLRRPGFLLLASGVLALGIGASVAVFTLVYLTLLRPLPLAQPDRLVAIGMRFGGPPFVTPEQYLHLKSVQGVVASGLVTSSSWPVNAFANGVPQQVQVTHADRHLLPTLGLHMALGHNFTAREDAPHGPPVVMLGHGYWKREYAGRPDAIGKQLVVKGAPHTIIGVLPERFDELCQRFLHGCDIMLPTAVAPGSTDGSASYYMFARTAPGVSTRAVASQVNARMRHLANASWESWLKDQKFWVRNLATVLKGGSRATLTLFMAAALIVLLIAWVNLANLLFLRSLSHHHDGAIRAAMGASAIRRHVPMFAESLLAAICGALLGVPLAAAGIAVLRHYASPMMLTRLGLPPHDLRVAWEVWPLALGAAVLLALSASALGLRRARRVDLQSELHDGGRSGASLQHGRIARTLVVVQVALATTLLASAGLFLHAVVHASQVDPGFDTRHVLTFGLTPVETLHPDRASIWTFAQRVRRRLAGIPGVLHADVGTELPTGGSVSIDGFWVIQSDDFQSDYVGVDPDYFASFAIPVIEGRAFTRADQSGGEPVAIVNQAFARLHFGGDALGQTLHATYPKPEAMRIVGIVGNTRDAGPLQLPSPIFYMPMSQIPDPTELWFALRVRGDPNAYRKVLKSTMTEIAPMQPIGSVRTMRQVVVVGIARVWIVLLLVGLLAVLALLLAAAGIYAVMAETVAAREHEFGVRTALGASPRRLIRLVLGGGAWQIALGLAIGLIAAVLLAGTLKAFLAQIGRHSALDPWALGGVCVVLAIAGLLACLLPALRAGRVQPMHALRGE